MNEQETTRHSGEIHDMGVLDLRYATSPEDLKGITAIHDVGVVILSESAASALASIQLSDVGSVVTLPSGVDVNCMTGQIKLSGAMLENGDPDTILFLVGQTMIQGEIKSVGYKEIRAVGQLLVPRSGMAAFSAKLKNMTGQILYVADKYRLVMGEETFDEEFLEMLPEPTAFVVMGSLSFSDGVTKELLQTKATEFVLMGSIRAPKHLASILNVLTVEKFGHIETIED